MSAVSTKTSEEKKQQATYLTLISIFAALFVAFLARKPNPEKQLRPLDLIMLGLAVYRGGRLIAYDKVAEPLRSPFTETKKDASGAGDTVEPAGSGVQKALGQLIACPTCAGTWVAAILVYGLHILPTPTRVLLAILSASGAGEILNSLVEDLSWTGRAARKQAGS